MTELAQLKITHTCGQARTGEVTTARGKIAIPAFMPVGTRATVKGLTVPQIEATGADIILGNCFHLELRPSSEQVAAAGGLHKFSGWRKPILTDSGGFQVFSLASSRKVTDQGVKFRSPVDGSLLELTATSVMRAQQLLDSDIHMVLDQCPALPATAKQLKQAVERTLLWARQSIEVRSEKHAVFGIVQGGTDVAMRQYCLQQLEQLPFDGLAVGGLSVGESQQEMLHVLENLVLPEDRPRYLMGVGTPLDIAEAVSRGIDMFDCVMPTRNARNAHLFTDQGVVRIRNQRHATDHDHALEEGCPCLLCQNHSRSYLHHLFRTKEMLGPILATIHNLTYYQRLMSRLRGSIEENTLDQYLQQLRAVYQPRTS